MMCMKRQWRGAPLLRQQDDVCARSVDSKPRQLNTTVLTSKVLLREHEEKEVARVLLADSITRTRTCLNLKSA